jgi:hypothetical protein
MQPAGSTAGKARSIIPKRQTYSGRMLASPDVLQVEDVSLVSCAAARWTRVKANSRHPSSVPRKSGEPARQS